MQRRLIFSGASLAIGALAIASLAMNFRFGYELGRNSSMVPWFNDGFIFGGISVFLDLFKIALPVIVVIAAMARGRSLMLRGIVIAGCLAIWTPITIYSFNSAFGTALLERSDSGGIRAHAIDREARLQTKRMKAAARNPWTAQTEQWKEVPSATITAQIAAYQVDPRWKASAQCTDAKGPSTRGYCQLYYSMEAAMASAVEQEQAAKNVDEIDAVLDTSTGATVADPNARAISKLSGVSEETVLFAWAIILSLLLEIVPNVGPALLLMAYNLLEEHKPKKERKEIEAPAAAIEPEAVKSVAIPEKRELPANVVELHPEKPEIPAPVSAQNVIDEALKPLLGKAAVEFQEIMTKVQSVAVNRGHGAIDRNAVTKRLGEREFPRLPNRMKGKGSSKKKVFYNLNLRPGGRRAIAKAA